MARHSLQNFSSDSPIIATAGPAKPRVFLVRDDGSLEEFWDIAPVRHRAHTLAECPNKDTCPQRPYDVGRRY